MQNNIQKAPKPALASKGMSGALVAFAGSIGSIYAIVIQPQVHQQAAECLTIFGQGDLAGKLLALSPAIAMAGSVLAAYGRWAAGGVKFFGKAR